ncbi:hypothetical protein Hac_0111 [Helicobacter acinonychis str. Sheeba]|uniref:Uncharacterized protein n=1 Tax=Helicobacter acinonychis (strain Sheeba) TaxID=382638 RepID=Q17ZG0_HELAH|nr:hypothetical protein Hac_0111 [Helicobacter acinonychis str. Sheeba]
MNTTNKINSKLKHANKINNKLMVSTTITSTTTIIMVAHTTTIIMLNSMQNNKPISKLANNKTNNLDRSVCGATLGLLLGFIF